MFIAFPVCHREIGQAKELARWIEELGGCRDHHLVLALTRPAKHMGADEELVPLLRNSFKTVSVFVPHDEVEIPWPNPERDASSANHLFKRVAQHMNWTRKTWFLWLEMDAVPVAPGWADAIEMEYLARKKPFMGVHLEVDGIRYMSGIGCYPANIAVYSSHLMNSGRAPFDVAGGRDTVRHSFSTDLIQYVKRNPSGPADWSVQKEPVTSTAVLYHRSKDLALITHLRKTRGLKVSPAEGNGVAGEPQTGCVLPHETTSAVRFSEDTEKPQTITDAIRMHCNALLEIAKQGQSRRQMVNAELKRVRLRK